MRRPLDKEKPGYHKSIWAVYIWFHTENTTNCNNLHHNNSFISAISFSVIYNQCSSQTLLCFYLDQFLVAAAYLMKSVIATILFHSFQQPLIH